MISNLHEVAQNYAAQDSRLLQRYLLRYCGLPDGSQPSSPFGYAVLLHMCNFKDRATAQGFLEYIIEAQCYGIWEMDAS